MSDKKIRKKAVHASKSDVLDEVTCIEAADELGLGMVTRNGRVYVECPFHLKEFGKRDRNIGNCIISKNGRHCHCFACGGDGNAIDMVMAYESLSFCDATDWLAEKRAPHLLLDTEAEKGKKRDNKKCPFSEEEFQIIGIHTSEVSLPYAMVSSKYDANKKRMESEGKSSKSYREIIYPDASEDGYVLICHKGIISIRDIFRENKALFWSIVEPKAMEACEKYRHLIDVALDVMPEGELRDAVVEEASSRLKTAKKFVH